MLDLLLEYESVSDLSADLERIRESMTTRRGSDGGGGGACYRRRRTFSSAHTTLRGCRVVSATEIRGGGLLGSFVSEYLVNIV